MVRHVEPRFETDTTLTLLCYVNTTCNFHNKNT